MCPADLQQVREARRWRRHNASFQRLKDEHDRRVSRCLVGGCSCVDRLPLIGQGQVLDQLRKRHDVAVQHERPVRPEVTAVRRFAVVGAAGEPSRPLGAPITRFGRSRPLALRSHTNQHRGADQLFTWLQLPRLPGKLTRVPEGCEVCSLGHRERESRGLCERSAVAGQERRLATP